MKRSAIVLTRTNERRFLHLVYLRSLMALQVSQGVTSRTEISFDATSTSCTSTFGRSTLEVQ